MKVSQTLLLATCCVLGCQGMRSRNAGRRAQAQLNNAERMKDPTHEERPAPLVFGLPAGSYTATGVLSARIASRNCTTRNTALTVKNANGGFVERGGKTARGIDCMYCVEPNSAQANPSRGSRRKPKHTSGCMYVGGGNSDGSGLCTSSSVSPFHKTYWTGIIDFTGCN